MEYEIDDLIGMLNLGLIVADAGGETMIRIPRQAALELITHLEDLNVFLELEEA